MNTSRRKYEATLAANVEAIRQFAVTGGPQIAPVDAVISAIDALPSSGVAMRDYQRMLAALVIHFLDVRGDTSGFESHLALDAAHAVEAAADWFADQDLADIDAGNGDREQGRHERACRYAAERSPA